MLRCHSKTSDGITGHTVGHVDMGTCCFEPDGRLLGRGGRVGLAQINVSPRAHMFSQSVLRRDTHISRGTCGHVDMLL